MMIAPLADKLQIPLIVTLHGYDMSRLLNRRGYRQKLKSLFDKCSMVICVSEKFRKDVIALGCNPNKAVRHYIGVPVEEYNYVQKIINKSTIIQPKEVPVEPPSPFCPPPSDIRPPPLPLNFLQVARFTGKKGHSYTLQALKNVLEAGINGKLIFAGDGPLLEECSSMADKLGIAENVEFKGKIPMQEIPLLLKSADIFIQHSITPEDGDTEGIPIGLMEAMAVGLPVLSTEHSGIPELVIHGKSGFLSRERDVETFSQRWVEMAGNSEMRQQMGLFNRKRIEQEFNMTKQNEILRTLYHSVIQS
jgi:glycosyltransferase involved in cell wall biosynthesis